MATVNNRKIFINFAELLQEDIANTDILSNDYYMFASKITPWDDEINGEPANTSIRSFILDTRKEMIFGKKIKDNNFTYLINRNTWQSNTKYDSYDDSDPDLYMKKFFVINSNDDVYKCICNCGDMPSTIEPTSKTNDIFLLSDGYKWKYMFSVSSANNAKYGSVDYIPYDANVAVIGNAVPGTIDDIVIMDSGRDFEKFATGTIRQVVSSNTFKIESDRSIITDYYKNCALYISSGNGDGNITMITAHFTNSSGIFIKTANNLTLNLNSDYIISPKVDIVGDGNGAKAYSTVNLVTGEIDSIIVVDAGSNYTHANVSIRPSNFLDGEGAVLRGVVSPVRGHGSNPIDELFSQSIMIKTEFANSENNTIPTELSYRKYGLIKNVKYPNGNTFNNNTFNSTLEFSINIVSTNTTFVVGETFSSLNSTATGIIGFANSSKVIGVATSGSFSNNEYIVSNNSEVTAIISNINSSEINVNSGEILFYDTTTVIDRSNNSTEDVGLIIKNNLTN